MSGHELILIGGSARSLGPLTTVLQGLRPSFPACVLVVVHGSPATPGNLARVLDRTSRLSVSVALDGLPLQRGVFVARPDHHLVVARVEMLVTLGPKENVRWNCQRVANDFDSSSMVPAYGKEDEEQVQS